jgi:choline-sulfatase
VQFHSLLPLLDGNQSPYEAIYGAYLDRQRSIRTGQHKLIVYPKANVVRLYDLQADPGERHDLAGDTEHRQTLRRLFDQLKDLQVEMEDELDLGSLDRYRAGSAAASS